MIQLNIIIVCAIYKLQRCPIILVCFVKNSFIDYSIIIFSGLFIGVQLPFTLGYALIMIILSVKQ